MTNEEQRQELLKLVENLDWESVINENIPSDAMVPVYPDKNFLDIVVRLLKEHQKQPTIERQLEELGFVEVKEKRITNGLTFYKDNAAKDIYIVWQEEDSTFQYKACIPLYDTDKILDFAKYLKELKEKDEAY